jgi:tRNA(fMet)-specific endonuclease VapC
VGILIDTSVLIAAERGDAALGRRILKRSTPDEPLAVAAITVSELHHGVHRLKSALARARAEAFVEGLLAVLPVMAFDERVARMHARVWADLAARGQPVGAHDLIIGATALAEGYRVASRDRRSFPRVPDLELIEW